MKGQRDGAPAPSHTVERQEPAKARRDITRSLSGRVLKSLLAANLLIHLDAAL